MESIEIWMWIIAGLLLGGLIFTGAYTFFSRYIAQQEKSQAYDSFEHLQLSIGNVCLGGSMDKFSGSFVFPYSVEKIYVADDSGVEGKGSNLCIKVQDEDERCLKIGICSASMKTLDLSEKTSVFYMIQKALGKKMAANIEFSISKTSVRDIEINWTRKYVR
jgi:hypothetical protein